MRQKTIRLSAIVKSECYRTCRREHLEKNIPTILWLVILPTTDTIV